MVIARLAQDGFEICGQAGMSEREIEASELLRQDALAGEKQGIGHFAEEQAEGKGRNGE